MKSTLTLRFSIKRLFLLTLVSFVAVAALLGISASANKANRAAKAREDREAQAAASKSAIIKNSIAQQPAAPLAPAITATLSDNIPAATKVAPGGTINYTATITNTGVSPTDDATNLNFSDTLDSNTTLTAGSIHASPLAFNDTYNWVGNTFLDTAARALPAVTANDVAVNPPGGTDTFTLTTIAGGATSLGGSVTLAANGSFTYTPPLGRPNIADGASVADTFTYTITSSADATLVGTGTVIINLTGRVWYVQDTASNGTGLSSNPFNSPASASTAADKSADIIYIFSDLSATKVNGNFALDNSQQLLGQGVNLVVNSITLFTAGAAPTTTDTTGNGVTLGNGNTLRGFDIGNCSGTAISGTNVGTLTVNTLSINTTGAGLDLTGVSTPTVNVVLGGLTSTGGTKNVNLVGLNGTITLAGGALSGASGNAFDVNGGAATITYSGNITNSGAKQVNVANTTGGSVALSGAVNGTGTGINLATNTGATISFTGGVTLSTGANPAFAATGGGTVTATQNNTTIVNTLTTTNGTALNITNTTIGASGLTFRSISSNGATNGIILNSTGATGGLTVSGNGGSCTSVGTCTGGTIQSAAIGVSLATTTGVSFDRMFIQNTTDSGINGTAVTNFSFTNGKLDNSGNAAFESNIAFNTNPTTASNVAGTLTLTGNTLTNAFYSGLDIQAGDGTITNANISNNTFISTTSTATSVGFGININGVGTATTAFSLNNATITGNTITNFPSASGIQIDGGNSNASGPRGTIGIPSDPSNLVSITSNAIQGQSAANRMGGSAIIVAVIGGNNTNATTRSRANINISNNPTLTNIAGTVIGVGCNGHTTMTATVNNNVIVANHQANLGGANGIGGGDGIGGAGAAWTPALTLTVTGNNISQTDGNGILLVNRATNGTMDLKIASNTVGAPINAGGTARQGIRLDSGNNTAGEDTTVCVTISGNTSAGSNGAAGIGIRKQGSTVGLDDFGITGLAPSPATGVQAAAFVVTQNAGGGGCDNISGSNFVSCATAPPIPNPGDEGAMNVTGDSNPATSLAQTASSVSAMQSGSIAPLSTLPIVGGQQLAASAKASVSAMSVKQVAVAPTKSNRSDARLSHHAVRSNATAVTSAPNAPLSGENVTLNTVATLPAGKSITIKYAATVNTPPTTRQVSTQGTVSGSNFVSVLTDDPDLGGASDPTVTLIDTLSTWTGATNTDWNVASNWNPNTYVPGTLNPGVNDVVIPNVGAQPNIISPDVNVFSLSLASGRTLTINGGRTLTISGGAAGSDLTLDGIISGGALNFAGAGPHVINNAGGTGSLTSTNLTTLLSPASVTLNNNLQMGALAVNSGATMNITNRTLSLNGSGAALTVGGTLTTTGSTVVLNGTSAQTIAGTTYNNLTINNTIGAHVTGVTLQGNATVNGALTLTSSDLATTGAFTLTMPATATSGPATSATDVVGNVKRTGFVSGGTALSFGNPFNTIRINSGIAPTDINILIAKNAPTTYTTAVQRSYTITPNGGSGITATVRLHYRQSELNGNSETPTANFNFRRLIGTWKAVVPTSRNVGVVEDNWLESNAVTAFSEWTFSNLAPTASGGVVSGRIVDNNGVAVEGAVVRLAGTQNRKFITDANGFYRFDNVETNGFYTVTPSRANYTFNPSVRSFSQIGETTEAAFGATLTSGGFVNPLDTPEYFVRQHYLDFLGREPDEAGFNFWSDQILECDNDNQCIERRRENVSAAYFLSIEFQQTGGLVDGLYRSSYGARPQFAEFMPDTRAVALDVVVGRAGWEAKLEANKLAFVDAFVQRPAFINAYGNMDNNLFVDTLISHTGVSFTAGERDALVSGLTNGTLTRSAVLRSIAENGRFVSAKFNEAFVMMEYFGYLRRDPDASGFQFWLNKLSEFNGNFERAEMVKAFIVSGEFRDRFPR